MTRGRRGAATTAAASPDDVAAVLQRYEELPKAVVFDADYTIWPLWCECFSPSYTPPLYPDVVTIMDGLRQAGVKLALASRTPTPHVASAFLDKLGLRQRFHSIQLIPAADGLDQHRQVAHRVRCIVVISGDLDRPAVAVHLVTTCICSNPPVPACSAQKDKAHFPAIQRELGIDYQDMLFYDDEHGNIRRVSTLGVCSILVDTSTGVDLAALKQGLEAFTRARQAAT
ncbi:hypothetical protein COHA_006324 [Chlorella ohadii]|uniref:Magnesium-dependent phosphatase 1 n=1 Tax=Chlorella ohadii TaxID=2649997 RepID=A0AAD5H4H8_9CHLO|nr:hypothetical protein COHA_006324 [Chlorella ohadii]